MAQRSLADFIRLGWRYIDPATYIPNWHIDAIAEHLEAVNRGDIRRLIINIPPRHMKSIAVSVAWPAWTWAQNDAAAPLMGPKVRFLASSYAHSLSIRDSVKCRRLIESPWYQRNWGGQFAFTSDQNTKIRFENDHHGYRIATSVDGTTTGEGGDVVLVDDPLSASEAGNQNARKAVTSWWDDVMSTRLNDAKTGAYVVIMQRLHEQDLVGHILERAGADWTHLCLPARYESDHPHVWARDPRREHGELLWPARQGETEVSRLETALGPYGAAGQLQQRPAPREGGIFKIDWWKYYNPAALPPVKRIVQSWDTAFKTKSTNDYSVCTTWAETESGYYLIHLWKERVEFPELKRIVASLSNKYQPNAILVEDKASGQSLLQEMQRETKLPMIPIKVDSDKVSRANAVTPLIQAGLVHLPDGAPWVADYITSLAGFPTAAHDDDVDSTSQALNYLSHGGGGRKFVFA